MEATALTREGRQKKLIEIEAFNLFSDAKRAEEGEFVLIPSPIDIGLTLKNRMLRSETVGRLSARAMRGGIGTVVLSSKLSPPIDDEIALEFIRSQAKICEETEMLALIGGIDGNGRLSNCATLLQNGAAGIEFDSHADGNLIRRLMEYAKMSKKPIFCHANNPSLQSQGQIHEGRVSSQLGLAGISPVAETSEVARIIELAEFIGVTVVFFALSTPRSFELCAQSEWAVAQCALHHLVLSDRVCEDFNALAKLMPPLRSEAMREAMLQQLQDGKIDLLSSWHTAASYDRKDIVFGDAAFGIDSIEEFLPLALSRLVDRDIITLERLIELTSLRQAELLGIASPKQTLVALGVNQRVDNRLSPYDGWQLTSEVVGFYKA